MDTKRTEASKGSPQTITRREFVKSTALGGGVVVAAAMAGPVAGQLPDMAAKNHHTRRTRTSSAPLWERIW